MSRHDAQIGQHFEPYVARLEARDKFVRSHLAKKTGDYEVHKRLVKDNPSDLISGDTNFSKAPYEWFYPQALMESSTPYTRLPKENLDFMVPEAEGGVSLSQPHRMAISPYTQLSSPSTIMAHESAHSGQGVIRNRAWQKRQDARADIPKFTTEFNMDLMRATQHITSPYQFKSGFGYSDYETMAFLMGREAELPAGQTLLDDLSTSYLFARYPDMYKEYTRVRDRIKSGFKPEKK